MEQRWRGQLFAHSELLMERWSNAGEDSSSHTRSCCALPPGRICVDESAEMGACLELLRLGVMALHMGAENCAKPCRIVEQSL